MNWCEEYPADRQPTLEQMANYIASPHWQALCTHLESCYMVQPKTEYSQCSGAPGWNVKYRKSGRALCTLYPNDGYFTCMVSVGGREATEAELMMPACTPYIRQLYQSAPLFNGGRWLMIEIRSEEVLQDVKKLIALRVAAKK